MMNQQLLQQLADGKPHRYQQLSQVLNLTEDQLQNILTELIQQGIQIEQTKTDCIWQPAAELLDHSYLQQTLPNNHLIVLPVIDSTNQYLLDHLPQLPNNSVCLAEYQTAGRGRRGRKWISPFAGQVILSFYHCFPQHTQLSGLSLAIGIAVAQALTSLGYQQVQLKWPNDIWLAGKKLGGILIEMKQNPTSFDYQVVIGLGLNIHLPLDTSIDQPIAMLSQQKQVNRNQIIAQLIQQINQVLAQFSTQGLTALLTAWQQYDYFYQQPVKLLLEQQQIRGIAMGINPLGELLLQTEQGDIQTFAIGEISLRAG